MPAVSIPYLCKWVEFLARFTFCNIPAALLAKFPEVDRVCSILLSYLMLQAVGFCWAFLVNGAFAIACQAASFLPFYSSASTVQLVASFYFAYASARVVISFAHCAAFLGYQSLQDFPAAFDISKRGADRLLHSSSAIFLPILSIELAVLFADATCSHSHFSSQFLCHHTGLQFLAVDCPSTRRIMFFTTMFLVMQVWQVYLYQYPRWDEAMRDIPRLQNFAFQLTMLLIAVATLLTLAGLFLSLYLPLVYENYFHLQWLPDPETWTWIALLGWTVWLMVFSHVVLISGKAGEAWVREHGFDPPACTSSPRSSPSAGPIDRKRPSSLSNPLQTQPPSSIISLQNMVRSLRLSQMILFLLFFFITSGVSGYLKAQLDLTLITIATPALVVAMYSLMIVFMQLNSVIIYVAAPFSFALSLLVCSLMTSRIGGKGSIMLVFAHAIGKSLQYFGNDLPGQEDEDDEDEYNDYDTKSPPGAAKSADRHHLTHSLASPEPSTTDNDLEDEKFRQRSGSRSYEDLVGAISASRADTGGYATGPVIPSPMGRRSTSYSDLASQLVSDRKKALIATGRGPITPSPHVARHTEAIATLAGRGQTNSALVSAAIPHELRHHWILKFSSRVVGFGVHMARSWAITNTAMAGVMKAGTALGVVVALILGIISIASVLQQNMQLFPKLISYHTTGQDVLFNHIISNVSLVKNPLVYPSLAEDRPAEYPTVVSKTRLRKPYYTACELRWNSLSLLDLSIFSELSYFDEVLPGGDIGPGMQGMLDELFPDMGFLHIKSDCSKEDCGSEKGEEVHRDQTTCSADHDWSWPDTAGNTRRGDAVPEWMRKAMRGDIHQQRMGDAEPIVGAGRGQPLYLEAYSEKLGVTVIAVRGTDVGRLHDFLEDVKLFAEPVLLSLLSCVFPLMRLWADTTTSTVIQILHESNNFFGLVGEAEYYQPLVQKVRAIARGSRKGQGQKSGQHRVILTGHSLGGGLSRIVGALTTLPSVSFAPPGIALSHTKYGMRSARNSDEGSAGDIPKKDRQRIRGLKALHDQSMAVLTDSDWIPQVDQQVGLIQKIMCDAPDKSHQNACHLLEGTICHLLQHCGDDRQRFVDCTFSFNINTVVPFLEKLIWTHKWIAIPILLSFPVMITLAVIPEII